MSRSTYNGNNITIGGSSPVAQRNDDDAFHSVIAPLADLVKAGATIDLFEGRGNIGFAECFYCDPLDTSAPGFGWVSRLISSGEIPIADILIVRAKPLGDEGIMIGPTPRNYSDQVAISQLPIFIANNNNVKIPMQRDIIKVLYPKGPQQASFGGVYMELDFRSVSPEIPVAGKSYLKPTIDEKKYPRELT